ncbi:MAG: hypothetical protein MI861_28605, partial [Pirellulales bacterium]|nr:hypothetical protein [Pirellulales bacterium]
MDLAEATEAFVREGYVHLPGFFDASIMDHLDALIERHFGANPKYFHTDEFLGESQTEVVPWFPQREGCPDFDAIEHDVRFVAFTEALLGAGWRSQYCMVMFS